MDSQLATFEQIVRDHHGELINFHYRSVRDRFQAEDLAQETFLRAYKKFDTLKDPAKVRSWLYAIARNVVVDFFRKNNNRLVFPDHAMLEKAGDGFAVEAEPVHDAYLVRHLGECIDQLVQEDRAIVRLLYYEGFSYDQIAVLLHMNENTLKSRLHRARKKLASLIRASEPLADVVLQYEHGSK